MHTAAFTKHTELAKCLDELQTRKLVCVKAFFFFNFSNQLHVISDSYQLCVCIFFHQVSVLLKSCRLSNTNARHKSLKVRSVTPKSSDFGKFPRLLYISTQFTLSNPSICVILFFYICVSKKMNFAQLCQAPVGKK